MDALFHFAMSFAGGYILLKGLRVDFRWRDLFLLSVLAGLIDLDHIISVLPQTLIVHNLTFVLGLPLLLFLVFRYMKRDKLQVYSLVVMVMLIGHLLADMITGVYGVPLFFPFYSRLFMIPHTWNFIEVDHSYVIAPAGIAVALYFGLIFSILFVYCLGGLKDKRDKIKSKIRYQRNQRRD